MIPATLQQTNIDYRVKDADKYLGKSSHGCKQISKIVEKAREFIFAKEQQKFQLEIIFKSPAIITGVELRVKEVNLVAIDFYNQGDKITTVNFEYEGMQIKVCHMKRVNLGERAQRYDRAIVRMLNYPDPRNTYINYIFFKGYKEEGSKKKPPAAKNVSDSDVFEPATKRKVGDQQKKIFETRNKQKSAVKVTSPDELIKQVTSGRKSKVNDQEEQFRRAIEQSKKQHQKKQQKQKQTLKKNPEQKEFDPQDYKYGAEEEAQFFDYDVVQWQKVKKVYEHVTPEWIEAQKKVERERKIQARHSVAGKIVIKVFKGKSFCLNNISGTEKTKLVETVKQMGGKIIEQPSNGCTVITRKMQGGKINMAKQQTSIKFVKPEYIEDCSKMQAMLDQKQYRP